ncbi:hypothetical protein SAMN05216203_3008 [Marinobacter daqiaonensis]|uniref:Short C-terminal domain-containing protein n=1 Tax=Marinobacter daqiaonensis TaxID=650891 RepID=A0A1I6JGR3_9GAMM|nr:SHOCT domain-containing protein [Marinobacter daqiaonensis]SFR78181.1 hypothetical protein SAMN05216203_3008 [Marinobacter daqiaonensis]
MRIFYLILFVIAASGCTTHKSPLQSSDKFVFATTDEKAIFQAAYDAMLEGSKGSPIVDINGPIRGYMLTRNWALDYWTSVIRVFPAEGMTRNGETIRGYYPEVSGEGTLIIRGPSMDERIYEAALQNFGEVGSRVDVVSIERGEYRLERDAFRLHEKASLRDGGTINIKSVESSEKSSVEERLKELDRLRSKDLITDDEYDRARDKVLEDI